MGKGRAPCCDKSKVKRGPWNPAEDLRLITFIQKHGHENWRALPKQAGLLRCGKSCRLRWINYLRPDVKRGNFTQEEEETIIRLHETLGNKWSKIASYLPGRTDNEIKNVWNTHLKKKLNFRESSLTSSSSSSSSTNVSSGKRNAETELDEHHNYVPKKSRELKDDITLSENVVENSETEESNNIDAPKEMKITKELSSYSCSSDYSTVFNSCQVDATRPEEPMGSSNFEFSENFTFGTSMNNLEEVNKPEIFLENVMEIPLESDFDFWAMLDRLESFQSNEAEASQSSSFGEGENKKREVERRKWFEYLEIELGLEAIGNENKENSETMAAETTEAVIPEAYEILLKPEVDPGITYFQLWNSPPESSVI